MAEKEIKVGIGDMKFARGDSRVITYALGSCIGITFYDPLIKLGALLHIMLPELVYTILITIVLYFIILRINQKLEYIEKRSASKFV